MRPICQVIALSAVKYHVTQEAWRGFYKPLWLGAALLNSAYSFFWDVERDWEISFFTQIGAGCAALWRQLQTVHALAAAYLCVPCLAVHTSPPSPSKLRLLLPCAHRPAARRAAAVAGATQRRSVPPPLLPLPDGL